MVQPITQTERLAEALPKIPMFQEGEVDKIPMFQEGEVDKIPMFQEGKVDKIPMFQEGKVDTRGCLERKSRAAIDGEWGER